MVMKKRLFKSILSIALALSFVLPNVAFAQDLDIESYKIKEDGVEKSVCHYGDTVKLISWENDKEMVFEQYDENDELVERIVVDKNTECATSYTEELGLRSIQLVEVEDKDVASNISSRASTKKVDTVKAFNALNPSTKTMDIYETITNADLRHYSVPTTGVTVATCVAQIALALGLPAEFSQNFFGILLTYGICEVVDNIVVAIFEVRVDCRATYYDYYGKDTASGKKSTTMRGGATYKVTDSESKYFNKTYSEGEIYSDKSSSYRIAKLLVQNLYGVDFDVQV